MLTRLLFQTIVASMLLNPSVIIGKLVNVGMVVDYSQYAQINQSVNNIEVTH